MIQQHFDRSLLPPPKSFYEHELGQLSRPDRKGWAKPKSGCPFHASKSKKSFSVNVQHGAFFCFKCGEKGGNVLDFVMRHDGLDFRRAAQRLGAWRDLSPDDQQRIEAEKRIREQSQIAGEIMAREERRRRIAARERLHYLEQSSRAKAAELSALARDCPNDSVELDYLWGDLALLEDQIRAAEGTYRALAGLEQGRGTL